MAKTVLHPKISFFKTLDFRLGVGLLVLVGAVFWGVLSCEFIYYDTEAYITANPMLQQGFSPAFFKWAFTAMETGDWQPLVWISYLVDYSLFGLNASFFHAVNLSWFGLNVLLIFWVCRKLSGNVWAAAWLAALYAVHPLRVESVAWMAGRKDLLSGVFWWLTILAYSARVRSGEKQYGVMAVFFYVLAAFSKPVVVVLPFILLVLDYWPLGRLDSWKDFWLRVKEKIPFFIVAVFSGYKAIAAVGKMQEIVPLDLAPLGLRMANAVISYGVYIWKTFFPLHLAIYYPFPHPQVFSWLAVSGVGLGLVLVSVGVWKQRQKRPYLLVGWLWYVLTLLPVIGILRVSYQAMADRYTFYAHIGLWIMVVGSFREWLPKYKAGMVASGCIVLAGFSFLTLQQVSYWRTPITLNQHANRIVADNYVARANLGYAYFKRDNHEKALEYLRQVTQDDPNYAYAGLIRAEILIKSRKFDKAEKLLKEILLLFPNRAKAHYYLGINYAMQKKSSEAEKCFLKAMGYKKTRDNAQKGLAELYVSLGKRAQAEEVLNRILDRNPNDAKAHDLLGFLAEKSGQKDLAEKHYLQAFQTGGVGSKRAGQRLALLWLNAGKYEQAESLLDEMKDRDPGNVWIDYNLSQLLMKTGREEEGMALMREVMAVRPDFKQGRDFLAQAEVFRQGRSRSDFMVPVLTAQKTGAGNG